MKLTIFILLSACLGASAKGNAQTVSISEKNSSIEKVIQLIKKQTGYKFLYKDEVIKNAGKITIDMQNASLEKVLEACFKNQPIDYTIIDNTIVLKLKGPVPISPVVNSGSMIPPPPIDVHGVVKDEKGTSAAGISVRVKGTTKGTITNDNGEFDLEGIADNATLIISGVNIETREVVLNGKTSISINVRTKISQLEEIAVVNTGYQIIKKEIMTGSATTISSTELEKRYTPNIINNLEGRVPGLVNYKGTTTIRGVSTLQSSTATLIVVDGLPIEGSIANINTYDVESITVLKDAAAAAIYGARSSNGVIVVVTKKAREKRTVIEFSGDVTTTAKTNPDFHLLSPSQQVDLESGFWNWYYLGGTQPTPVATTTNNINLGNSITPVQYAYYQFAQGIITQAQLQTQLDGYRQNNFRQQYKDNALVRDVLQQYNIAIRTNTDKMQSSIVVNYKGDNTGIINGYNHQLNLFYKGTYNATKWLNVNYGVNTILGEANATNSNFAGNPGNVSPYMQLLDASGNRVNYTTADFNLYNTVPQNTPQLKSLLVNHLDELSQDRIKSKTQNTRYYLNMDVKIIPGLTFNPYFQYESNQVSTSAYSEAQSYAMRLLNDLYTSRAGTAPNYTYSYLLPTTGGKLTTTQTNENYWTARGQLNYTHEFGKHLISIIGGGEFRQTSIGGTKGLLLGYDDQLQSHSTASVNFNALSLASVPGIVKPQFGLAGTYAGLANSIGLVQNIVHRFASGYANASYAFNRKYLVFGSFRKDYADVFGLDPKFRGKPLWSVGTGWNVYKESFMSHVHWVNFLKLRATYGVTGNINLNTTSFLTATTGATNLLTQLPLATVSNPANPALRWEKTTTANLGLDFNLLQNRLSVSIDWYHKKSTDLFANTRLDPATGFSSYTVNNGGLLNNGIELSLGYSWFKPGKKDGLSWSTYFMLSQNNNKITYVDQLSTTPVALAGGGYLVGYPANSLFSFQYTGLNAVGQPQWVKADKTLTTLALTASDLSAVVYSGHTDPKTNMALTNEFNYKGFNLDILMVYYGGQSLRADIPSVAQAPSYGSMPSFLLNSWTPTNTNTNIPGFGQYVPPAAVPPFHLNYSDAFVRAGDFIKIRNVVLGYNLSQQLAKKIGSTRVNVHFQLNNPKALWVKNKIGIDPETGGAALPASYVFGFSLNY